MGGGEGERGRGRGGTGEGWAAPSRARQRGRWWEEREGVRESARAGPRPGRRRRGLGPTQEVPTLPAPCSSSRVALSPFLFALSSLASRGRAAEKPPPPPPSLPYLIEFRAPVPSLAGTAAG